jgi:Predicted metal-binding integral membrane protein (DUF2182)/Branched-chain amino acid ATP-binding cassette transporter
MLLLAAGIYQLSPLKRACLKHCRSPLQFILAHWGSGASGAFRMGIEHGAYCVGCCWVLMGLLFFGGIMNLYWIIGLAIFVLLEKTIPTGHRLGDLVGMALIVWETQKIMLIFIEHDMDIVFKIAPRICVLCYGRLLAEGTPAEIRSNPAVIEAYLGVSEEQVAT